MCLGDTCTSEVHTVLNPFVPYRYLLPNMYLFIAVIANLMKLIKGIPYRNIIYDYLNHKGY